MERCVVALCMLSIAGCVADTGEPRSSTFDPPALDPTDAGPGPGPGTDDGGWSAVDAGMPGVDAGPVVVDSGPPPPDPCFTSSSLASGQTHPSSGYFTVGPWYDEREYMLHIPASYTGEHEVPVVLALHGMFQTADKFGLNGSDLVEKSEEEGFIVVFPNGPNSWNAGTCCPLATLEFRDDVGFIREVVDDLVASHGLCVDRERVYGSGFSNGGYMAYRLGCQASDIFAAIASVAGALLYDEGDCAAQLTRPVPMLHLHGDSDNLQPEDGSSGATALGSIEAWAGFNGCDPDPVPATELPVSQLDTTCITYPNCDEGAETSFCSVAGGGHCWYGNDTCGAGGDNGSVLGGNADGIVAADAIWEFFSRHTCPSCED